jgi:hypothetical protein
MEAVHKTWFVPRYLQRKAGGARKPEEKRDQVK